MSKSEFGQMTVSFLLFESPHYLDFAISNNNKVGFEKAKYYKNEFDWLPFFEYGSRNKR